MTSQAVECKIAIELKLSQAERVPGTSDLFMSKLSHPALSGELIIYHTEEGREHILQSITADPRFINPVKELVGRFREFVK